ncbi:TetR/AcrR family transcriptional regulator [Alicyclobacillus sp. SO9]|uniref:TetR/AcrR family transcriptional regulator n=1 Tax=Alicyclobacillus sp. SO9 TaxID=2665646 RepID=UPI0018E8E236|nr:TetR/AcrR family transcriptional regulator [Alicyclobacillus sp. SO9]QQE78409.1 TetR/AcrR family transcriptional regulator [Alicyclobacillus sp. SO9]
MVSRDQSAKREEILRSAAVEFAEKGFEKANINHISINAGIGKGTIYLYFKTKQELYLATIQTIVDQFNDMGTQIMLLDIPPIEKIHLIVRTLFSFTKDESYLPFLKIWARHQFQNDPVFPEEVSKIFQDLRQPLCEIIHDGVERGDFHTSNSTAIGYVILEMIVMLMPELQPPYAIPMMEHEDRIPFVMEVVQKVLQTTN